MKYIICVILLFFSFSTFSQPFSIGVRGGLGSYSMDMLKDLQQLRTDQTQLPLKITDNYPITPFFRVEAALNDLKYVGKLALFYSFSSTGARSTVSDYSGRADLDATINGHQFGLTIQKDFYNKQNWSAGVYGDISMILSTLKTTDNLEITFPAEVNEIENYTFQSKGYAFEPGAFIAYRVKPFVFQANLGVLGDSSKKLHLKGNDDMFVGVNNNPVKPQWFGLRLGLQVSYVFSKNE